MLSLPTPGRLLDESPRWLAVRGYHTHALAVLQRAARWNGVDLPPRHRLLQVIRDSQNEVRGEATRHARMNRRGERTSGLHKAMMKRLPVKKGC